MNESQRSELLEEAGLAKKNAFAPFSNYAVGSAVLTKGGRVYRGCNIENSSYGLTMCAERVALFSAVAAGEREFSAIAVAASSNTLPVPCGACRQVIWEHCGDIPVLIARPDGKSTEHRLSALLPNPFQFRGKR